MDVIDLGCGLCFGEKYWSGFILQAKGTFCQKKKQTKCLNKIFISYLAHLRLWLSTTNFW